MAGMGIIALMMGAGDVQAAVSVGVDATTGAIWRSGAALGLNGSTKYGADGYTIYGLNAGDGSYVGNYNGSNDQTHLPAAITSITRVDNYGMWSGNGNFGQMQDPDNGNVLTSAPLLANGDNPGIFTMHRTGGSRGFRLTILVASGDGGNVTFTTTVNDGVSATQNAKHNANGLYYHVYDVAAGSGDVTVTVGCSVNYSVTGFAFDMMPVTAEMLTFNFPGYGSGVIDQTARTIAMTVPYGTVVTNLAPTYTLTPLATAYPVSGSSQDFTAPRDYVVTGHDGSSTTYHVTVTPLSGSVTQGVDPAKWSRSVAIQTVGYAGTGELSDFPLLVRLDPAVLTGFAYGDLQGGGRDLRFTDADNTGVLTHEIESWNTNGVSQVWVRLPKLTSTTVIRAYWGNPAAPAPAATNRVWDQNFRGVWHLTDNLADATSNANSGTNSGTISAAGMVGQGRTFNGSGFIDCGNSASLNVTNNQLTLSAWINPSQLSGNTIIGKSFYPTHSDPYYAWILYAMPTGLHCRLDTTTVTAGTLTVGQWQHVAATYDGSYIRLFVNGVLTGSTPKTGNLQATSRNARIGGRDTSPLGEYFNGALDEVRISAVARSANWIQAERDTVANAGFCNFGAVLPTQPNLPMVTNSLGATNLLATSATLAGTVVSIGAAPSSVWLCWGDTDAGTNVDGWTHSVALGARGTGSFTTPVTGLNPQTPYYYRCRAANSYGESWSGVQTFTAFAPLLSVSGAQMAASQCGQSPMRFIATLSAAYPENVSFDYELRTASPSDFQAVSGSATFLAGQTQVFIDVMVSGNTGLRNDRYFLLDLSNSRNAVLTSSQSVGLVLDDERDGYLSPCAVVADASRSRLYVAEQTATQVAVVNLSAELLWQTFSVQDVPNGLALSPDGTRLYVAAGVAAGKVFVLNALTGDLLQTLQVGHTPMSPVVSPDGSRLYVCNRFNNDVSVIAISTGETLARIPVDRQPHTAALTPDGRRLFVANLLPTGPSTSTTIASVVSVIDTPTNKVVATVRLPVGAHSLRGLCVSPDGASVFVTHLLSRFYAPTTQVTRGWMNTAGLSIIDAAAATLVNTVLLDDLDLGAANPWGVACTADGQYLCVAHAGTHEISVIDRAALLARLQNAGEDVPQDLTFMAGFRRRLPLKGNGPRGIAVAGTRLYAAEYFSDSVAAVSLVPGQEYAAKDIWLGWPKPVVGARLGERNYNDATLCLQQWQSCASCHPDARADSLNWDLMNDGFGSPKNTKSHLYSMQTPPVMVTGIRANAQIAIRAGLKYIEFTGQPEALAQTIDAYLASLTPVPSPYLVNGALSASAVRGQTYFQTQGCVPCHSGPYLTDQLKHDIGTGTGREAGMAYDTPTLREVWRTAPYLHDGRAATVREVITTVHAARVAELTDSEIDDLTAYVLSL